MSLFQDTFNQASWLAENGHTPFEWGTNSLSFSFLSPGTIPIPDYFYEEQATAGGLITYIFFGLNLDNEDIIQFLPGQKEVIQFLFSSVDQIDSGNAFYSQKDYRVYISDVVDITLSENTSSVGDITLANADVLGGWGRVVLGGAGQDPNVRKLIGDLFVDVTDQDETVGGIQTPITLLSYGQFGFFTLLHEGLHAATASFSDIDDLSLMNESRWDYQKYTILSYRVIPEIVRPVTAPEGYDSDAADWYDSVTPYTLQLFDIFALQQREENRNYQTRDGSTIYSLGQGFAPGADGETKPFIYTIWDGGGVDLIDASGFTVKAQIDLRQGAFSSIGVKAAGSSDSIDFDDFDFGDKEGDEGNVAIALYTVIENALGTSLADSLIGNDWVNYLQGDTGDDVIFGDGAVYDGDSGFSSYDGDILNTWDENNPNNTDEDNTYNTRPDDRYSDNDTLDGGEGTDKLYGGYGDDIFITSTNSGGTALEEDIYHGGGWVGGGKNGKNDYLTSNMLPYAKDGYDTVDYSSLSLALTVDTNTMSQSFYTVTGGGKSDKLYSIDHVKLGSGNDTVNLGVPVSGQHITIDGGSGTNTLNIQGGPTNFKRVDNPDGSTTIFNLDGSGSYTVKGFTLSSNAVPWRAPDHTNSAGSGSDFAGSNVGGDFTIEGGPGSNVTLTNSETLTPYFAKLGPGSYAFALPNYNNTVLLDDSFTSDHVLITGTADDHITLSQFWGTIKYRGGDDVVDGRYVFPGGGPSNFRTGDMGGVASISMGGGISISDVHVAFTNIEVTYQGFAAQYDYNAVLRYDVVVTVDGYGSITVENMIARYNQPMDGLTHAVPVAYVGAFDGGGRYTDGGTNFITSGTSYPVTFATNGADVLTSPDGDHSKLAGLGGADTLIAGSGNNTLLGGDGDDTLNAGGGTNIVYGGRGADLFIVDTAQNTGIQDYNRADGDVLKITDAEVTASNIGFTRSGTTLVVTTPGGPVAFANFFPLVTPDPDETWEISIDFAGSGSTVLEINAAGLVVGASRDPGTMGPDYTVGGGGDDTIATYSGADTLEGGLGNNTLSGGTGGDTYIYGGGHDTIHEAGESSSVIDTILMPEGVAFEDLTMSRSGDDLLIEVDGSGDILIVNQFGHGSEVEQIRFDDGSTFNLLSLDAPITGTSGANTLTGADVTNFIEDTLRGLGGNDTLSGGLGADRLEGGDGDDVYVVTEGPDSVTDTSGTDKIVFGAAYDPADISYAADGTALEILFDDVLVARIENQFTSAGQVETLQFDDTSTVTLSTVQVAQHGTSGADVISGIAYGASIDNLIYGEGDADTLTGGTGDDTLDGGAGNDRLEGGADDDVYIVTSGFDTISDTGGNDTIQFGGGFDASDMTLVRAGNDLQITLDGTPVAVISGFFTSGLGVETIVFDDTSTFDLTDYHEVTGTSGADTLSGLDNALLPDDVIIGLAGADTLSGGKGDDLLQGGSDSDTYVYDEGEDTVSDTGGSTDKISFASGFDLVDMSLERDGATGLNILFNDVLAVHIDGQFTAAGQIETLSFYDTSTYDLTAAAITTTGTGSADVLTGIDFSGVSDLLEGLGGADTLIGNAGNDTLDGGNGSDTAQGGTGNDLYIVTQGVDDITDTGGTDTVSFGPAYDPADISLERSGQYDLNVLFDSVLVATIHNQFTTDGKVETLAFDDTTTLDLSTVDYTVSGTSGDDVIYGISTGGDPDDVISGGNGEDTLYGLDGADTLDGGDGDDMLQGGAGNDTYIYDDADEDLFWDTAGTDTIVFGAGYDSADLEFQKVGTDLQVYFSSVLALTIKGHFAGTGAIETLLFDDTSTVDLTAIPNYVTGTSNGETLAGSTGTTVVDYIQGLAGNDTINANAGDDFLDGGAGNDSLTGGTGDDTYVFELNFSSSGVDTLAESSSEGFDTIYFKGGIEAEDIRIYSDGTKIYIELITDPTNNKLQYNTSSGSFEQVTFDNGEVIDLQTGITVSGTSSGNSLPGTTGNDTIIGKAGDDSLYGDVGDDTYIFERNFSTTTYDRIYEDASEGTDTIWFTDGILPSEIRMYADTTYLIFEIIGDASDNTLRFAHSSFHVNTGAIIGSIERVIFDDGTVWNLQNGLTLTGSSSGETMYATANDDIVDGLGNADVIYGYAGDDVLTGGTGNDSMAGGDGDDVYVFAPGYSSSGYDNIIEADNEGNDTIWFTGGLRPEDIRLESNSGYIYLVQISDGSYVRLAHSSTSGDGVVADSIEQAIFDDGTVWDLQHGLSITGTSGSDPFLYGTTYADTINGKDGNDTLTGYDGDDIYLFERNFSTAYDAIVEAADSGTDMIRFNGILPSEVRIWGDSGYIHIDIPEDAANNHVRFANSDYDSGDGITVGSIEYIVFDDGTVWDMQGGLTITGASETVYATIHDDIIYGRASAADDLYGFDGNDTYVFGTGFTSSSTADVIHEASDGGTDTIVFEDFTLNQVYTWVDSGGSRWFKLISDPTHNIVRILDNTVENIVFGELIMSSGYQSDTDDTHTLYGSSLDDEIHGNGGNDTILGFDGDDTLDGGSGQDAMTGGDGDDIYVVDHASDSVTESSGEGEDTVQSSITYTLGSHLENLTLLGSSTINGKGNGLDNTITGNDGANSLAGGAGNDTYVIGSGDTVTEVSGEGAADTVMSSVDHTLDTYFEHLILIGSDDIDGTGNSGNNTIAGNSGENTLTGGDGDDVYFVGTDDVIVENSGEGTDIAYASASYTLSGYVEDLTLTGTAHISGTGNSANNTITGNEGNNTLDGGGGTDELTGGDGNDVYVVDTATDTITEGSGADSGTDAILSSITFDLGSDSMYDNIENLGLTGSGNVDATGNAANNILLGNEGNNTLDGDVGVDTMLGGEGDDSYVVDDEDDVVFEEEDEGTDSVFSGVSYELSADIENLTLTGSSGLDATGNDSANAIVGNTGSNSLTGGKGDDTLSGAAGSDIYLFADGDGNDEITDSAGTLDYISFDATVSSASAIYTRGGNNLTIAYGTGTDTIVVTDFFTSDTVEEVRFNDATVHDAAYITAQTGIGTPGNDSLVGTSGVDTLSGLAGDDILQGFGDNDVLDGGADNDTLDGGTGADSMDGGAGNDLYIVDDAGDAITDASGTDTVQSSVSHTLVSGIENLVLTGSSNLNGTGNSSVNSITGNSGNNTLSGEGGDDVVAGGAGNDVYVVDSATDTVTELTGEGTDAVQAGSSFTLGAYVENLTLTGSGNTDGTGNSYDNTITGNTGNNTLDGGAGNDTLIGGTGNDAYVVDSSSDVVSENSSEGTDTIYSSATTYTIAANVEHMVLTGSSNISGTGNSGANSMTGNDGNNTLDGSTGNDTLAGGKGDDTYIVDSASDVVTESSGGGTGTDTVNSTASAYTLSANVENLVLGGSSNIDGTGNSGANAITGNSGDNDIDGDTGNDSLSGGGGSDTYHFDDGDGDDVISDSAGTLDIISFGAGVSTGSVDYARDGNDLVITYGTGSDSIVVTGFFTGSQIEEVHFNDTTVHDVAYIMSQTGMGTSGNDSISGTSGADTITGLAGDDTIYGLGGNDIIDGGADNDTIDGGTGADSMSGGTGNDIFVVDDAGDTVSENASEGTDTVQSGITYTLTSNVENLVLTGSSSIDGTGNSSANSLTGNSGANTLSGGSGADVMAGGGGDDTYVVDNTLDTVTEVSTLDGADTINASVDFTISAYVDHMVLTGSSNLNGTGNAFNNSITGNTGNNTLDGGAANDTLAGGNGDDTYVIDSSSDVITESSGMGTGTDTALSSATTYTISANVENLTLTGTGDIHGTGNTGTNTLTGNSGNNSLDGGAGADAMIGGAGNDTYIVDDAGDSITESSGTDTVRTSLTTYTLGTGLERLTFTGTGANTGTGNSDGNIITGNSNNDTLDGSTGADTLIGGLGNDLYIVDDGSDVVTENGSSNEGTDTVQSSQSYTLSTFVEILTLTGSGNINGTGNASNNTITGNSGTNALAGGAGDDLFIVGSGDTVSENSSEGTDTVESSVTFTISDADVENLTLTGSSNINGTGNSSANTIIGNSGVNVLDGGTGNVADTLDGGGGADTMSAGNGNDAYYVDNASDVVSESSAEGTDTVNASVSYTITDTDVENLTLTGSGNINGTGNTSNNYITGNTGNNSLSGDNGVDTLDGGAGNDTLAGGAGNDTYIVDSTSDILTESSGADDIVISSVTWTLASGFEHLTLSGSSAINGTGSSAVNTITGNSGDNTLDGGAGNDVLLGGDGNDILDGGQNADDMAGGLGDDVYYVAGVLDTVTENGSEGTDTIHAEFNYTLDTNFENLYLDTGTNGGGNSANNIIYGNSSNNSLSGADGNDTLDGGAGNDTMNGGLGDDIFIVDSASDTCAEASSQGTDTAQSSVTYTISDADVENLTLTGSSNINGTGNTSANVIIGNTGNNSLSGGNGNDTLDGGDGTDTMTGGSNADTFVFKIASYGDVDTVTDFTSGSGNDVLDVRDLLIGYSGTVTDFVRITDSGSNSVVEIDRDGTGGSYSFTQIATLNSITGLTNEATLVTNGNLLVS